MWMMVIVLFWGSGQVSFAGPPLLFDERERCHVALERFDHPEMSGPDNPDGLIDVGLGYCVQVKPPVQPDDPVLKDLLREMRMSVERKFDHAD